MAYIAKDLTCTLRAGGSVGYNEWLYDTVDALSDIYAAGYISNACQPAAGAVGMEKGDLVRVRRWTTAIPTATSEKRAADGAGNDMVSFTLHWVIGISATTGAADLTDGLAITATNT